jgi:uncharacterized protein YyaL (SSP411 family)
MTSTRIDAFQFAVRIVLSLALFSSVPATAEPLPGAPPLPPVVQKKLSQELDSRPGDYKARTHNRTADGKPQFTNRLILEPSPYLQQHAHNPVNWYPWGDEAFETAAKLGRPVLVSIGYSTCHWCHVMEEESFDDIETARVLNENFIAIKVDREARPDVDAVYMAAVHAMGQRGGWPLNVWLTPERKPFFGGTYFPPIPQGGRPSFRDTLNTITQTWSTERPRIESLGNQLGERVAKQLAGQAAGSSEMPEPDLLIRANQQAIHQIDPHWGGIGGRTKFPSSTPIRFLLRYHRRTGDETSLRLATLTLDQMANGGLYDQVGGGFHRYSTDPRWLVPHFEKMLYDNALLVPVYLEAAQVTGNEEYRRIAREVLDYVALEMTAPGGAFYSATDADSQRPDGEMEEGWFFTWTPDELQTVLGPDRAQVISKYYGVTPQGNFEGRNILHRPRSLDAVARELGISKTILQKHLDAARGQLYTARAKRPPPLRDAKIISAWNGLMISAFARGGLVLNDPAYVENARRAARFILDTMRDKGRLSRINLDGRASGPAFLEDYAFLIAGLLDLYEADPNPTWLQSAIDLQTQLDRHYADPAGGGYFKTADDQAVLLAREKPERDGAIPSGNSVEALNLLRLYEYTTDDKYHEQALLIFASSHGVLEQNPSAASELLLAFDYFQDEPFDIVIIKPETGGDAEPMLAALRDTFVPNRVLSVVREGPEQEANATVAPVVEGRKARKNQTTAYVCVNRVCAFPTTDAEVFAEQLRQTKPIKPQPR